MKSYLKLLLAAILMSTPCLEVCAGAELTKDTAGMAVGRYLRNRTAYRDAGASGEGVLWDFSGVDFSGPGHKVVCEGDTLGRYRVTGDRKTATHTAELVALHHRFYIKDHLDNNRRVIDMDGNVLQQTDYYPFGTPHADNASSTSADLQPYKYNGKELDGVHGLNTLDYGARQYHAAIPRWDRVDPLCEKYYHASPYAYCLNNPVRFIDPDGSIVIASDKQSQMNILNTLNENERNFVRFKDGVLDNDLLVRYEKNSVNYAALKALSCSKINYTFAVNHIYKVKGETKVMNPNAVSSTTGVTLIPGAKKEPSPDKNVYIYVCEDLSIYDQALTTAHEAYGHAYYYELKRHGKGVDPFHRYKPIILPTEKDPETGIETITLGRKDTNTTLLNQIKSAQDEVKINYKF